MTALAPELPLFAYGKARRSDPQTSHDAAASASSLVQADQRSILRAMRDVCVPMAAEQISHALGWNDHVRVNRRLSELADQNLIRRTEEKHVNKSGRSAFRYALT